MDMITRPSKLLVVLLISGAWAFEDIRASIEPSSFNFSFECLLALQQLSTVLKYLRRSLILRKSISRRGKASRQGHDVRLNKYGQHMRTWVVVPVQFEDPGLWARLI